MGMNFEEIANAGFQPGSAEEARQGGTRRTRRSAGETARTHRLA
jgi:hypothetical protein